MGATRDRWAGLVRRWRQSGQTARQFAASAGINAATLSYWAWQLKRGASAYNKRPVRQRRRRSSTLADKASFVELIVDRPEERRFELDLADGRRLRIPPEFDAGALGRLLAVLADRRG
jgi:hypothetical protein